jgi:hypothetical protein
VSGIEGRKWDKMKTIVGTEWNGRKGSRVSEWVARMDVEGGGGERAWWFFGVTSANRCVSVKLTGKRFWAGTALSTRT